MGFFRRLLARKTETERVLAALPARHKLPSIISSADDAVGPATARIIDIGLKAAARAKDIDLHTFSGRPSGETAWWRTWPGEHYKLLTALVAELGARRVIEIGTFTGMGTIALSEGLPQDGVVTTFDITPWNSFSDTWLTEADFSNGRIRQEIADIGAPGKIEKYAPAFCEAEFIFIDGPKDGVTEAKFIHALSSLDLPKNPIVMFDDIRVLNMVGVWRQLNRPKLDLTSFGHWSGTGLVDWNG